MQKALPLWRLSQYCSNQAYCIGKHLAMQCHVRSDKWIGGRNVFNAGLSSRNIAAVLRYKPNMEIAGRNLSERIRPASIQQAHAYIRAGFAA